MAQYEPLLREALRRRPAECDVLVISLGYDTLDGDPCAAEGHRPVSKVSKYVERCHALHDSYAHTIPRPLLVLQADKIR